MRCEVHQNKYMTKSSAITVRLPRSLRERLQARAESEHRSLSAQVVADLERAAREAPTAAGEKGCFLGLFTGTALPADQDFAEVRSLLWGRLGHGA